VDHSEQKSAAPTVRVVADMAALTRAAEALLSDTVLTAVEQRGRCTIALAGGATPRALYELIAADDTTRLPWNLVDVWFGDERCVPPDDAASNYRMAHETLLAQVPLRAGAVHRMRGELVPQAAADAYEAELRAAFPSGATFDVVLLGVGGDGHTASLFPGAPTLDERARWAVPATSPPGMPSRDRVTLTYPALDGAREAWLLCVGAEKRRAVHAARLAVAAGDGRGGEPASRVRAREGTLWLVDRAAAGVP